MKKFYYGTSSQTVFVRFLGELKTPKRHFEINWPLVCYKRIWAAWNLDEFIKVKAISSKNSDRNASSWRILTGESRWLWKSFRIHQEFCCHLLLWQNSARKSWQSISICCLILLSFSIFFPARIPLKKAAGFAYWLLD